MPKITQQKPIAPKKMTGTILDQITEMEFDTGIKINLYGRSATGKTTLWATFPGPILALICSGIAKPGELRSINTPEYRKKIRQLRINKMSDLRDITDVATIGGSAFSHNGVPYKTIVLDHSSSLQDLVMKEILGLTSIPAQGSWGMAKQQDWGQGALQMKEYLRALLGLSINVVIVAQEREFHNDEENTVMLPWVGSALMPSVTGWLNPACDYICQTFIRQKTERKTTKIGEKTIEQIVKVKGVEYCLRTAPDATFTTKFRVPKGTVLPDDIVDPSYSKIMALINGPK